MVSKIVNEKQSSKPKPATQRGIKLRISRQRLESLQEICAEMIEEFKPANAHQHLLNEYLQDLVVQLKDMLARNQELYTLIFCGFEATAFYQLWQMLDISRDKYANLIVDSILKNFTLN